MPRTVLVVGGVLAVLLIVPLIYVFVPSNGTVSGQQTAANHKLQTGVGASRTSSPEAAAIAVVEDKTGLKYSTRCTSAAACLSIAGETVGKNAAAIVFSTAPTGGRQCVAYVYKKSGWHPQDAACALPGQVAPLVGRDATVHVPGSCANARDSASLNATVVTCVHDGSTVHVTGGPVYTDGFIWWRTDRGWIAHDFLIAP